MSNSTTATVETLTAEVRVLMVGSRQVTLSVYKQLDRIPIHAIKPFGRVRSGSSSGDGKKIEIVGADRDGKLCASWFWRSYNAGSYQDPAGVWRDRELAEGTWGDLEDLPLIVLAGLR